MIRRRLAALVPALISGFIAAGCHTTAQTDAGPPGPIFTIDAGFLFGAAIAGYQVEGGDDAADWHAWERVPLADGGCTVLSCGEADQGPDFVDHASDDLTAAGALGLNGLRFSLEWERLQPSAPGTADGGTYDSAAIAYYHGLLADCASAGLTPMVTLTEGTLPDWLHAVDGGTGAAAGASATDWAGGWRGFPGETPGPNSRVVQAFGAFAGDMAAEFGGEVDLWLTEDSPMDSAEQAYVTGSFPPGGVDRLTDLQSAIVNLSYANAAAYDAIHTNDTVSALPNGPPALVGSAHQIRLYLGAAGVDPDAGAAAAEQLAYVDDLLLPDAFIDGDLDTELNGAYDAGPGGGVGLPGIAGRADFLGINYRGPLAVIPAPIADSQAVGSLDGGVPLMLPGPTVAATIADAGTTDAPVAETIDPTDLTQALLAVSAQFPLLPIYVTELTLNEDAQPDMLRPAYLVQAVAAVQSAMAQGVPVRGVFYRSLVDGLEWQYGFAPRTGLFRVDFTDPARPRTVTQGAQAYGQLAKALGVTPAIEAQWVR